MSAPQTRQALGEGGASGAQGHGHRVVPDSRGACLWLETSQLNDQRPSPGPAHPAQQAEVTSRCPVQVCRHHWLSTRSPPPQSTFHPASRGLTTACEQRRCCPHFTHKETERCSAQGVGGLCLQPCIPPTPGPAFRSSDSSPPPGAWQGQWLPGSLGSGLRPPRPPLGSRGHPEARPGPGAWFTQSLLSISDF